MVQTPAQGVPFTHRLMIVAAGDGVPWNVERPRAKAEPRLEQWAARRLGAASDVVVQAAADGTLRTLDASGFCALDLIYESANPARLEQAIRAAIPAIPTTDALAGVRDPAWAVNLRSVFEISQLASSLHDMLVRARIAGPADFTRASDTPVRTVAQSEIDTVKARAVIARNGLSAALAGLQVALAPAAGSAPDDGSIRAALEAIAAYGVATPRTDGEMTTMLATIAVGEAQRRLAKADAALGGAFDAQAAGVVSQAIFGDGFWMIPAVTPPPVSDLFSQSLGGGGAVSPTNGTVRRFVRNVASVRDAVERFAETMLFGDAMGRRTPLRIAQLALSGTLGTDRWIGSILDPAQATPDKPVTNIVLEASNGYDGTSVDAALVIDQWVDVVPQRAQRGDGEGATIDERLVSGLAVNAPAASARAPQAILLAISPDGARWTTAALLDTLLDTLELAKLRGVTLERTTGAARVLPALYEQSWSLQGDPVLNLGVLKQSMTLSAVVQYVKEK
ncbi:MAG: hypothetical protein ABI442_17455 [Gemmatimonadaceae bacterium]